MKRQICIRAALCFLALVIGVGAPLADETACGKLIPGAQLEVKMAGACANTKCGKDDCAAGGCPYNQTTCTDQTGYCGLVSLNPGEVCNDPPGNNPGWNCSHTTRNNLCAQEFTGSYDQQGGCVGRCGASGAYCGSQCHNCTQTACGS